MSPYYRQSRNPGTTHPSIETKLPELKRLQTFTTASMSYRQRLDQSINSAKPMFA